MGRRGNQRYPRRRMAGLSDFREHLGAGQMTALAGLGTLGAFDLQFPAVYQIVAGNAEPGGGNLLHPVAGVVPVLQFHKPGRVFAPFAAVAHGTDTVHGNGDALVGFLAQGPVAHGAGTEVEQNLLHRLHLFNRNAASRRAVEIQQVAQPVHRALVNDLRILFIGLVIFFFAGLLQQADGFRIQNVGLISAFMVHIIVAAGQIPFVFIGVLVPQLGLPRNFRQSQPFDTGRRIDEILLDQFLFQAHRFKDLGSVITLHSRNAHLRHNGQNAAHSSFQIVRLRLRGIQSLQQFAFRSQGMDRVQRQVRIDGRNAVADQGTVMVGLPGFAGFQHQTHVGAHRLFNQVIVHRRRCQKRRHRCHAGVHAPVRQH